MKHRRIVLRALVGIAVLAGPAAAQDGAAAAAEPVDSLVAAALRRSPAIHAAEARLEAARAAVGPSGALPDPMLMAGIMNQPISGAEGEEMDAMAMRTVGVAQSLPYPGKRALERRAAEAERAAAEAELDAARWAVAAEVRATFYQLAFFDRAMEIVRRNERLLGDFVRATQSRYGVGTGSQADVLRARVEAARLAEEAVALTEQRRAVLARLNAVLDRPSDTPVEDAAIPERLARAAVPADAREVRFASAALGARAAGSPLPPLAQAQEAAVHQSPEIRAREAAIAAQATRVELARRAHLPDFDLSLQYGQRDGRSDVVSAMVSVPLPLRKSQKQDLAAREAEARLAVLRAERHQRANAIRAEVAVAHAELERERAQLALFLKSIIPQGRAALESATSSFQVGRVDFLALLESQATLFEYETAYHRSLTAFAGRVAELERVMGTEILR